MLLVDSIHGIKGAKPWSSAVCGTASSTRSTMERSDPSFARCKLWRDTARLPPERRAAEKNKRPHRTLDPAKTKTRRITTLSEIGPTRSRPHTKVITTKKLAHTTEAATTDIRHPRQPTPSLKRHPDTLIAACVWKGIGLAGAVAGGDLEGDRTCGSGSGRRPGRGSDLREGE